MNELEFLRQQVATEERNFAAVAGACAAALAPERDVLPDTEFLESCAGFLAAAADRSLARDEAGASLLRARLEPADAGANALVAEVESATIAGRGALARLVTALGSSAGNLGTGAANTAGAAGRAGGSEALAGALRSFLGAHSGLPPTRRLALEQQFERHFGIAEWRLAALVDADGILDERERHARVAECLPDGLSLVPAELAAPLRRAAVRLPTAAPGAS